MNAALPSRAGPRELVEDTLATLAEAGVNIVEEDDGLEGGEAAPWSPHGPLRPLPLQPGMEAPLDAETPRGRSDFSDTAGQTE
jgi:hypothetical protein